MKPAKLLLAEDNGLLARIIPLQMTKHGYEVVAVASSGEDAVTKAAQFSLDVVLMDIDLGGIMDGITAAATIQQTQDVPVVFISSHEKKEVCNRAQSVKSISCLSKPFTEKELALTIELSLYKHRSEREHERLFGELLRLRSVPGGSSSLLA